MVLRTVKKWRLLFKDHMLEQMHQFLPPPARLAEKTHTTGVGVKEQGAVDGYSTNFVLGGLGLMSPTSTPEIVY